MKRTTVAGIAIAMGALGGGSLVAIAGSSLSLAGNNVQLVRMPATSPEASRGAEKVDATLDASLAARVEVDGRHFNVYVGRSDLPGTTSDDVWSVAIPAHPQTP